ncbi:MAG: class I SAM-dependent methyltransferase [Desulfobacula sp.]|jgi:ubiquinone/menaquinone biosynthesis C-methylase UbiE|uniref:methyltransferase domain-containing protein n=1 Tax=Desulfobacula sp. TaxID=2593537 RepID=UPI0039B8DB15|nr:class I SAM-dependent methyltransferase [Desulfobacula sp.]
MKNPAKPNASSYCNYNDTFKIYDQLRQPNGMQEILHIFRQTRIPVEKQTALEGGFGTGVYIDHFRHHVKEIHGVEGSEQGFEKARQKMGNAENVHLQIGNILKLGFSDDFFHAYMVNQVLHHLDTELSYPNLNLFLKESRRVLKPGGVLVINTSSREQLDPHSGIYWSYQYIEKAVHKIQARYIPVHELISRLEELQFTDIKTTTPSGRLFQNEYYRNPGLILDPNFQKGDSVYCFLSENELNEANARVRSDMEDGSVHQQMDQASQRAKKIGESVIISARKPGN